MRAEYSRERGQDIIFWGLAIFVFSYLIVVELFDRAVGRDVEWKKSIGIGLSSRKE